MGGGGGGAGGDGPGERPAATALAFGVLVLATAAAVLVGAGLTGLVTGPLESLVRAAEGIAAGRPGPTVALPRSGVAEVARLTAAFADMRDRLARGRPTASGRSGPGPI